MKEKTHISIRKYIVPLLIFALCSFIFINAYAAQNSDVIHKQIDLKNSEISRLEKEIQSYQGQITSLGKEKQSLKNEISVLAISERKLNADIELAQTKISLAESTMKGLQSDISAAETKISINKNAITKTLQAVQKQSDDSLVEAMLRYENLSEYWGETDSLYALQSSVSASLDELSRLRGELEKKRKEQVALRDQELALRRELEAKAGIVVANKHEQAQILSVTENKESEYQNMLSEHKKRKEAFESEIRALESQLNLNVDAGAIPTAGAGVLAWPLDNVIITQYFGNTAFATANPQVYSGIGHNGIDLGAAIGTSVKSAAAGVVIGTGDTDLTCKNASYGRWILVKHSNGLSTLYGHLSQVGVSTGQSVARGEVIGYSGNTGYTTGPHLHFTVYASDGVKVTTMPSRACGGRSYTLPLADQKAYLNPLSFL